VLLAAFVVYFEFARYQSRVVDLQFRLSPTERELPSNVKRVFAKLTETEINRWVARNLLQSLTERTGNFRWHVRFAMWESLVPVWYSREERVALFAHFLRSKDAQGLEMVSRSVFRKEPGELSVDEIIGLLVVLRAPARNSPTHAPTRYQQELNKMKARLGAV